MQFSKEEVREVLRLLAGILHLGNIEFITAGGAQISFKTALGRSAELLGLDPTQLTDALTQRSMFLRGEEILTPLSVQQVRPPARGAVGVPSGVGFPSHVFTWHT